MQVIISSAFETSIATAQYACLAWAINQHWADSQLLPLPPITDSTTEARQDMPAGSHLLLGACAHGLATESWFLQGNCQDLLQALVGLSPPMLSTGCTVEGESQQAISVRAAEGLLSQTCCGLEKAAAAAVSPATASSQPTSLEHQLVSNTRPHRHVLESESMHEVITAAGKYCFSVCSAMPTWASAACCDSQMGTDVTAGNSRPSSLVQARGPVFVFLHGFLGDKEDWLPIMRALALTHHCVALDLPGHGRTLLTPSGVHACALACSHSALVLWPLCSRGLDAELLHC